MLSPCARSGRCRGSRAPAAGSSGPSGAAALRNENIRSLARLFSSSRRAPPNAASKPYWSSACFSACGLHDVGMDRRAVRERIDALRARPRRLMCTSSSQPSSPRDAVAERDHLAELPGRIDVQQRKRRRRRDRTPCTPDAASPRNPCRSNTASPACGTRPRPRGGCGCSRLRAARDGWWRSARFAASHVGGGRRGDQRKIELGVHAAAPTQSPNKRSEVATLKPRSRAQASTDAR